MPRPKISKTVLQIATTPHVRTEKDEEKLCDQLARKCGWQVVRFSQARATMQTEGIPDRLYVNAQHKTAMWWEVKRAGGQLTRAQYELLCALNACGHRVGCGTLEDFTAVLAGRFHPIITVTNWADRGFRGEPKPKKEKAK